MVGMVGPLNRVSFEENFYPKSLTNGGLIMTSLGSILSLLVLGGLVFFMMKKGGGCCSSHDHGEHNNSSETKMKKDPVCGMDVNEDTEFTQKYDGTSYHFCSAGCLERFRNDPSAYIGKVESSGHNHNAGCCH